MDFLYKVSTYYIFPSNPVTGTLGSIDFNVSLILWSGVPLLGTKNESKRSKMLFGIYGLIVVSLVTLSYTGFELYDLVLCWGNLNDLTQNSCLSLSHFTAAVKVLNLFYRRKNVLQLIGQFRSLSKKYVITEKQKEAFYWGEFENKMPLLIYFTIVILTSMVAMILAILNPTNIAGKSFPFRVKLPDFLPYNVQSVYMGLAIILSAMQIVGVDYLNVTLINQTRYQIKILNIAFERLAVDGNSDITDVNKYLREMLKHHHLILEIRKETENVFKYPLLLQFCTSMLTFAITVFQATVQSESSQALLTYLFCGCIFCELFCYCWFGNEVSEQSKTLAASGYNSLWYNFDQGFKKSLIIFMMNAQRPLHFTAGGFVNLSLQTFTGILSKSYSYIAFLRQMYSDK